MALSDPAFSGIPFVVAGLKKNQIHNKNDRIFDRESRKQQKSIEWVNIIFINNLFLMNFFKFCFI